MSGNFDFYFVWSHLMKQELLDFYVYVKKEDIEVVGTPQFEPYVLKRYKTNINDYSNKFSLDVSKKTICYSCGDVSTSRNDGHYIELIAKAIKDNSISLPVNFIVRTSPAEDASRFVDLKEKYPLIIWNYPKWVLSRKGHQETWSQRIPLKEDVKDLIGILSYSDVAVNMCSTMSLDAMFFDKPVVNPVFGNGKNGLYDDQKYLQYQHYKRVVDSGAVAVAKTKSDLLTEINKALETPNIRLKAQKELLDLQISHPLKGTGRRIVSAITKCIEK